ncbi:hypothetical protein J2D73_14520 [Acetobacter sacchari]|uniref:Anti-sigma factor NepR domain-containing protein n=2 Tax=Acetobacteraceae TaxID=433 RepID=A0ABS3LYL2_9PROT|nr:hypothetical protein [Acetobacter sacchari]
MTINSPPASNPDRYEQIPWWLWMSAKDAKSGSARKARRKREDAFEIWLKRGLHQLFDDVAQEPIPEELLRLIEEDRDS